MLSAHSLFVAQLIAHLSLFYFVATGSLFEWLICLLVYYFTGCIGMTATYHRLLSHRSWNCPKWIEYFGSLWATLGMTGSALSWVSIHRKHHRFSDTEKDPHCPSIKGFIYCQWFSMYEKVEIKYVADLVREPFYQFQHRYYFFINLAYAFLLFLLDPRALIYAWLAPACILWNAGSSIVTFNHLFGTNPNKIKQKARNIPLLGLLVWGEGWHNNHHHNASDKRFGQVWWQIDFGYYYIWLVEGLFELLSSKSMTKKIPVKQDL